MNRKSTRNLHSFKRMSLVNFRAYQLSLKFYKQCEALRCSQILRDQLLRAASSITLNLAEGSAKPTKRDRAKFYFIALGSQRECEAALELSGTSRESDLWLTCNNLGGLIFNLTKSQSSSSITNV